MPKWSGETCMNCGGGFVMQPGTVIKEGHAYVQWKCGQCARVEEWPAPENMQPVDNSISHDDFME
jgi:transcription elongation factor Elf1